MPDGRFLSKTIAHNEQLAGVSLEADYLFARCIPHLDSAGRMVGKPELVKAVACPLRPEIDSGLIPDLLRQLAAAGLVRWYSVEGKQVLEFPGFRNHQQGARFDREAASRLPASDSPNALDQLRTNSGPTPEKVRVSEVEVEGEVEVKERTVAEATGAEPRTAAPTKNSGEPTDATLRAAIAPAVRKHLWVDGRPPNGGKRWTEGNEITAARQIIQRERGRTTLEDLVGAIGVARMVLGFDPGEPLTLRIFNDAERGTQQLLDCVDYWKTTELRKASQPTMRRLGDLEVRRG